MVFIQGLRVAEAAKVAVAGALADQVAAERDAAGEQLDLVGLPERWSEERRGVLRESAAAARRRGRPLNARNIATREMLSFCRRVFGDPVLRGFQWLEHTPETLAAALGCTRLEAFDRLEAIRKSLQPLFYAAQAPVDDQGRPVPLFNLQIGTASAGAGARPPWEDPRGAAWGGPVIEGEQNQQVSETAADVSHGDKSHGEAK